MTTVQQARIRWAKDLGLECGEHFGTHRCVKDVNHETDSTNDDHQCCCGETYDLSYPC
jgi:hypothetical protein